MIIVRIRGGVGVWVVGQDAVPAAVNLAGYGWERLASIIERQAVWSTASSIIAQL